MSDSANRLPASDSIGALVHSAGRRAVPNVRRMELARRNVHAEWRAELARCRRTKWLGLAAAALACAAIGVWVAQFRIHSPAVRVAAAGRVVGLVLVRSASGPEPTRVLPERMLVVGDSIDVSSGGRVLLHWLKNADVRIDSGSSVVLRSAEELELARGTVYVETLERPGTPADISVSTPAGRVRHIGTQFEVRVSEGDLRVRVRDGAAVFSGPSARAVAIQAGEQLRVSGGEVTLEHGVAPSDPSWAWAADIAPDIEVEGRSLFEVLEVLGREGGLSIHYENADTRAKARSIHLHGRITGLAVHDALKVVLTGSGLGFALHPDRVEIHAARPP